MFTRENYTSTAWEVLVRMQAVAKTAGRGHVGESDLAVALLELLAKRVANLDLAAAARARKEMIERRSRGVSVGRGDPDMAMDSRMKRVLASAAAAAQRDSAERIDAGHLWSGLVKEGRRSVVKMLRFS
jgi:ATP-dependent Clp protease ATP-binding subunit ClpA